MSVIFVCKEATFPNDSGLIYISVTRVTCYIPFGVTNQYPSVMKFLSNLRHSERKRLSSYHDFSSCPDFWGESRERRVVLQPRWLWKLSFGPWNTTGSSKSKLFSYPGVDLGIPWPLIGTSIKRKCKSRGSRIPSLVLIFKIERPLFQNWSIGTDTPVKEWI